MTRGAIFAALAALFVLEGCKATKTIYVPVERTREVVKWKQDTTINVVINRPALADSSNRIQGAPDTVVQKLNTAPSVLENDVARSTAQVKEGQLLHNLEFLGDPIPWEFEAEVTEIRDSIPYPVEVVKPVRMELRWWEVGLQVLGVLFLILIALFLGARYVKTK